MNPPMPEVLYYRRRLPHYQQADACYFVTWRLATGQPELDAFERDAVVSALRHFNGNRYELDAFVVMNDHVHVIVRCLNGHQLDQIIHSWKSFTTNTIQRTTLRKGALWQDESFDRVIRDDREFHETLKYIENNPTDRWPVITSYRWLYIRTSDS